VGDRLSAAKRDERERRQRTIRLRRIGLALLAVVGVGLAIWAIVALYQAPIFTVDRVIVAGARHYTRSQILGIADLPDEATLLRLRVSDIERRLEADPWIRDAVLDRDFPDTVRISVVEREPGAVVDAGGTALWVASSDGRWLGMRSAEDTGLVVVRDVPSIAPRPGAAIAESEVTNAVRVVDGLSQSLRKKVRFVSAPSVEETALKTKGGVEIFVGEATSMGEKDRIIREILARHDGVVYINVRVVDRPTWRGVDGG
jgi:cell division protein FtsQ